MITESLENFIQRDWVAGVIVLYNPDNTVPENISSYIDFIDQLYAVDNSDNPDESVLSAIKDNVKITYISMHGNHGIGKALNTAAGMATDAGYKWLLTMDQDTAVSGNIVAIMAFCLKYYSRNDIGIIASRYTNRDLYVEKKFGEFNEMLATISSGNLLNLNVYKKAGPFMEKLFIDQVDHEYCMRLRKAGYKIIQANNALLMHNLGSKEKHTFGYCTHHNLVRRYFITRNRFYVAWMYRNDFPRFYRHELLSFIKEILKILFFEKNKLAKYKNILLGFMDFKNNNFNRPLSDLE